MSTESPGTRDIREILGLSKLEKIIMEYFIRHISAGEIIALIDLKEEIKKRIRKGESDIVREKDDILIAKEIDITMALLVKKGFLIYRNGVYSLSQWIIDIIKSKKGGLYPGMAKSLDELLD